VPGPATWRGSGALVIPVPDRWLVKHQFGARFHDEPAGFAAALCLAVRRNGETRNGGEQQAGNGTRDTQATIRPIHGRPYYVESAAPGRCGRHAACPAKWHGRATGL
jgi:hypothetical protein